MPVARFSPCTGRESRRQGHCRAARVSVLKYLWFSHRRPRRIAGDALLPEVHRLATDVRVQPGGARESTALPCIIEFSSIQCGAHHERARLPLVCRLFAACLPLACRLSAACLPLVCRLLNTHLLAVRQSGNCLSLRWSRLWLSPWIFLAAPARRTLHANPPRRARGAPASSTRRFADGATSMPRPPSHRRRRARR